MRILLLGILFVGCLTPDAWAQKWVRRPKAFARDQARAAGLTLPRNTLDMENRLSRKLGPGSLLLRNFRVRPTYTNVPSWDTAWWQRGNVRDTFSASINGQLSLVGKLEGKKIANLELDNGRSRRRLVPAGVTVQLGSSNRNDDRGITWTGPKSRHALLALLHELGHRRHNATMTVPERERLKSVLQRRRFGLPLTDGEKRLIIGDERMAWTHALRELRSLRREGFDPLEGVRYREIKAAIDATVGTYVVSLTAHPAQRP
jgi:hypothetical protein